MNWIYLTEKYPDNNIGVLITDGEIVTAGQWDGDTWVMHGICNIYECEFEFENKIIAWQPLPEPAIVH